MFQFSEFGESLSVDHKDNIVSFWIDSHGEATSFKFDLSRDEDMKKFCDLIRYLKDCKTYVSLNGKKTQKDENVSANR